MGRIKVLVGEKVHFLKHFIGFERGTREREGEILSICMTESQRTGHQFSPFTTWESALAASTFLFSFEAGSLVS